jgi:hypothetical protein
MVSSPLSRLRSVIYPGVFLLLVSVGFWAVLGLNGFLQKSGDRGPEIAPLQLASVSESGVRVDLELEPTRSRWAWLSARFTPLEAGYHLYAKDLPRQGVGGLGRPTLLELALGSKLRALGTLVDNGVARAEVVVPDQPALAVYPAGPVTLLLPVELPVGQPGWVEDQVSVTYMACNPRGCLSPVLGKLIPIRVPVIMDDQDDLLQANLDPMPASVGQKSVQAALAESTHLIP